MPGYAYRLGYKLPNCAGVICDPSLATPHTLRRLARSAEDLGYHSAWLHDHLATPQELVALPHPDFYEPLAVMASLAAITSRIVFGVATIILPLRDPILLSKQLATLDAFAPSRFILGVGVGRYEDEFTVLGTDVYHRRGPITSEFIRLIRTLWTDDVVSVEGRTRSIRGARIYPKPAQAPPIWVGGNSPAAIRRAARLGDGWVPAALTPDEIRAGVSQIVALRGDQQVSTHPFEVGLSLTVELSLPGLGASGQVHAHPSARRIRGEPALVAERLAEYAAAGVSTFLLSFAAATLQDTLTQMESLAREIS